MARIKRGYAIGIDIGTTTLSASVIDMEKKTVVENVTLPNACEIASETFALQDAERIAVKARGMLDALLERYEDVAAIGLTGQMHGMLYLNREGRALSPLVTWQDKRGELPFEGCTVSERAERLCGEKLPSGYGLLTHYYNLKNGLVPRDAVCFCSIMDYLGICLTGRPSPLVHSSVAASFGLYDVLTNDFKHDALARLGIDGAILPEVTDEFALLGEYRHIPVSVAIGDNQASFLGSSADIDGDLLVNIGTGSQISTVGRKDDLTDILEMRPLVKGKYLICGAALCGGASYALLERFFASFARLLDREESVYPLLEDLARTAYEEKSPLPTVDTAFMGTRHEPTKTASVTNLTPASFTPQGLTLGVMQGIVRELYELFPESLLANKKRVVAAGGAVRQSAILRRLIGDIFQQKTVLASDEAAALGAALFALMSSGVLSDIHQFADFMIP